jgi:ubiquitin-like 1-activating enzyme E1 B
LQLNYNSPKVSLNIPVRCICLQFDKDDDLAVEFVTAAANLRAACYHISAISLFDAKGMAGNIIHAIATTNAIIAGLIVQEALKLLASDGNPSLAPCRSTFLRQDVSSKRLLAPVALEPPNPACVVCGTARLEIRLDTTAWTLGEFISKILKGRLSMVAPTVTFGSFLYEEGEDLEPDEVDEYARHLSKKLSDLPSGGIRNNVHVELTDQAQALSVQVVVSQQDTWNEETHPDRFTIAGALPEAKAEASPEPEAGARDAEASMAFQRKKVLAKEDDDGALVLVDDEEEPTAKRKRRLNEEIVDDNAKRVKMGEGSQEEDVIELLD